MNREAPAVNKPGSVAVPPRIIFGSMGRGWPHMLKANSLSHSVENTRFPVLDVYLWRSCPVISTLSWRNGES